MQKYVKRQRRKYHMLSPIHFITLKEVYEDATEREKTFLLGEHFNNNPHNREALYDMVIRKVSSLDDILYLEDSNVNFPLEESIKNIPYASFRPLTEDVGVLALDKLAYFKEYADTLYQYGKILKDRANRSVIEYDTENYRDEKTRKIIKKYKPLTRYSPGAIFILNGEQVLTERDLLTHYHDGEYIISQKQHTHYSTRFIL